MTKVDRLVDAFNEIHRRMNPSDPVNVSTEFQRFLVTNNVRDLDERETAEAFLKVGVPPHQVGAALEELASWL